MTGTTTREARRYKAIRRRNGKPRSAPPTSAATSAPDQERGRVNAADWTPRELRHSFVSLLSDSGIPLEEISL